MSSFSVVPFEYSAAPPIPSVFALAKQAMKRGVVMAGAAAWAFTTKYKYNVAIWGLLTTTIGGMLAYDAAVSKIGRWSAERNGARIEAEIDAVATYIRQSMDRTAQRYEAFVQQKIDPRFNHEAWKVAAFAPAKPVTITVAFASTETPPLLERAESLPAAVTSAPLIDAAHVKRMTGDAALAARFEKAQKTCPAVLASATLSPDCQRVMNPLFAQLGDAAVALAKQDAARALAQATQRQHTQTAAVMVGSKAQAAKFVSAPNTKLLKTQQPRRDETNRPVRVAEGKAKKKGISAARPAFDGAEFWRTTQLSSG